MPYTFNVWSKTIEKMENDDKTHKRSDAARNSETKPN